MAETGKYIYGVINSAKPVLLREGERSVYSIPYRDISAVVSDSEIFDYNLMIKGDLAKLLVEHQKVIEMIMPARTIIPVKLGTLAADEAEVKDILSKGYDLIEDIMEQITGKTEIDIVSTWGDFSSALKEAGEDEAIKEFKQKLMSSPKGVTVEDRMKIGIMLKKVIDEKRQKYADKIQNALKTISRDTRMHEAMDDTMVVNMACLINNSVQDDFDRKVDELNTGFGERLNFRCVGPLPPYSFFTLQVKKMEFKELDWARRKLGLLGDSATRAQIKKAHQALAFSSHPDKNPDIPGIEKEFDDAIRAYKILTDYCLASEQEGSDSCSFKKEVFRKNAVLVGLKE